MRDGSLVDGASDRPVNLFDVEITRYAWDPREIPPILHRSINITLAGALVLLVLLALAPQIWDLHFRTVASGSMEPAIPLGAVVMFRPVDATEIQEGDVITFRSPEGPGLVVTHRVIRVSQQSGMHYFQTKGDANPEADLEPISEKAILGKVMFYIPYIGYLSQVVRQPVGWSLLIALPAAMIILFELIRIFRLIWSGEPGSEKDASIRSKR
jgi:signal peptidase